MAVNIIGNKKPFLYYINPLAPHRVRWSPQIAHDYFFNIIFFIVTGYYNGENFIWHNTLPPLTPLSF